MEVKKLFDNIMRFFKKANKKEKNNITSKDAAKERLHLVLMQDRANVSADFLDLMRQEIIEVIKKYIDVDESAMDVRLTNQSNEDGTQGAPALYANIPILNIKDDNKNIVKESIVKEEQKEEKKNESLDEEKVQEKKLDTENEQEVQQEENEEVAKKIEKSEEAANTSDDKEDIINTEITEEEEKKIEEAKKIVEEENKHAEESITEEIETTELESESDEKKQEAN